MAAVLRSRLEALDLYVKAVREAGVAGGWSASTRELINRSAGAATATNSRSAAITKVLNVEYLSLLPPGLQDMVRAAEDTMGFRLGVDVWSGDSLVLAYVDRGGLAAALGLRTGDKILLAGGAPPKNLTEVKAQIKRAAGSNLKIRVMRADRTENDLEVKVPKQLPAR